RKVDRFLGIRNRLGTNAITTVAELIDAPQLLGGTRKRGEHDQLTFFCRRQRTFGACDGDLKVRRSQVAAGIWRWRDRPFLLCLKHIVGQARIDLACRPILGNLSRILIRNGRASAATAKTTSPSPDGDSLNGQLEHIAVSGGLN